MRDKVINGPRHGLLLAGLALVAGPAASPLISGPVLAASREALRPAPMPGYARTADLVTTAPAIAIVQVKGLTAIPSERSPGLQPGMQRILISAETLALIRGNDVLSREISFLIDLADPGTHKPPKWKGRTFIIFGKVADQVNFFQLQASNDVLAWSPQVEAMVRRTMAELSAPNAPPAIRGISSAFHVGGAVEGEGETQVFLDTANGHPISLSIIRRPDEEPEFGASLGEVVDEAAALPKPDTPLWYRLACGLPGRLPARALAGLAHADAAAASKDYAAFIQAMGPCDRTATPVF